MNKRWSKEEVESIKEYAYHGMSIKEISERMNRSRSSIQNKLRILKNKNEIENNVMTEYEQRFSEAGMPIYRLEATYLGWEDNRK